MNMKAFEKIKTRAAFLLIGVLIAAAFISLFGGGHRAAMAEGVGNGEILLDSCDDAASWQAREMLYPLRDDARKKEGDASLKIYLDYLKMDLSKEYDIDLSGRTPESTYLEFWMYVENKAPLFSCVMTVSAGDGAGASANWGLGGIIEGWNRISLRFSDALGSMPSRLAVLSFLISVRTEGNLNINLDEIIIAAERRAVKDSETGLSQAKTKELLSYYDENAVKLFRGVNTIDLIFSIVISVAFTVGLGTAAVILVVGSRKRRKNRGNK
jgi:hypothetical protein